MVRDKNNALEGLRGIAAVVVVLSHCMFAFYPHMQICDVSLIRIQAERWLVNLPHTLYNGAFSVCVFFVMSGYVLTRKFFSDKKSTLENAAVKRYIRLAIPVFASVLIAYLLMSHGMLGANEPTLPGFISYQYHAAPVFTDAVQDGAWRAMILGNQTYDYVLWTIRIEFIGSMFLFAFLALFGRARWSATYAVVAVLLVYSAWPFGSPFIGMFFAGAFLHKLGSKGHSASTHAAMLIAIFYVAGFSCAPMYAVFSKLQSIPAEVRGYSAMGIGAVALVWIAIAPGALNRILSTSPFVWLGNKSFSVYLLHSFVLSTVGVDSYHVTRPHGFVLATLVGTLATIAVSLIVAIPFERLVDRPSVAIANAFGRWAVAVKLPPPVQTITAHNRRAAEPASPLE